ncbi:hypothetical protein HYH02_012603 [Chlamydomonas schloesseri]|uniref:Protein kinase domain-containing protein n=1 Tax=Chlamydomonas schloesseri TaxID=2026947 RepID=A0A835T6Q4_9CHLO|nr:hypothetical protein HYH02_012603 [Chlamydomonas schloesseri]|eukprot:KAG2433485.1 hypothetical protein HYH02_012603 [Chlamydomonas schloesseri]
MERRVHTAGGGANGDPLRTVDYALVTLTGFAALMALTNGVGTPCVLPDGRPAVQMLSAVKTVTATLPPIEQQLVQYGSTDLELLPTLKQMAQELGAYTRTTQRATDVHGADVARRSFLQMYGWELACTGPDTYALRSFWEWQSNGSLLKYLVRCLDQSNFPLGRACFVAALQEALQLLHVLSRAGIVLGDLKLENMLVDEHGHVKLSDVDGAGLLDASLLYATQAVAQQAAVQAAAACLDPCAAAAAVWSAADRLFAEEAPYMVTDAYMPLEMSAYGVMCAASHQHLLGASLGQLLGALQPLLLAAPGREVCWALVTELRVLATGMQTPAHTDRPDLPCVWAQLEGIRARWAV